MNRAAPFLPLLVALLLAACQAGTGASPSASVEATPEPSVEASVSEAPSDEASAEPSESAPEATVRVESASGIGDYVVDAEGLTLYIFLNDTPGMSTCTGDCAANWPPFTVEEGEEPVSGEGITGSLSTIERDDGSTQVTLEGMPLYYFAADAEPGDTNGEGVGDVWFVARPDGSTSGSDAASDDGLY